MAIPPDRSSTRRKINPNWMVFLALLIPILAGCSDPSTNTNRQSPQNGTPIYAITLTPDPSNLATPLPPEITRQPTEEAVFRTSTLAPTPVPSCLPCPLPSENNDIPVGTPKVNQTSPVSASQPFSSNLLELISPVHGDWQGEVYQIINSTGYRPAWDRSGMLTLETLGHVYFKIDYVPGFPYIIYPVNPPEPAPGDDSPPQISPDGAYRFDCQDGPKLYPEDGQAPLGHPDYHARGCTNIKWAGDSSAVGYLLSEFIYIWHTEESLPTPLQQLYFNEVVHWAPSALRYVVPPEGRNRDLSDNPEEEFVYVDMETREQIEFKVKTHGKNWFFSGWQTNEVITADSLYYTGFYKVGSGHYFGSVPRGKPYNLPVFLSPDQRWLAVYSGSHESFYDSERQYRLYDFKNETEHLLGNSKDNYLEYLEWKEDSSALYLISRPAHDRAFAQPQTPFGLLAFQPQQRKFEMLFEHALQVEFTADQSWAYVVFPSKNEDGSLSLSGGLWEVGSPDLINRQKLADETIYQDPTYRFRFGDETPSLLRVVWSHDETKVAVQTPTGKIYIFAVDGSSILLADNLTEDIRSNLDEQMQYAEITWSPTDTHLLITYAGYGFGDSEFLWLVTIPEPWSPLWMTP